MSAINLYTHSHTYIPTYTTYEQRMKYIKSSSTALLKLKHKLALKSTFSL